MHSTRSKHSNRSRRCSRHTVPVSLCAAADCAGSGPQDRALPHPQAARENLQKAIKALSKPSFPLRCPVRRRHQLITCRGNCLPQRIIGNILFCQNDRLSFFMGGRDFFDRERPPHGFVDVGFAHIAHHAVDLCGDLHHLMPLPFRRRAGGCHRRDFCEPADRSARQRRSRRRLSRC